MTSLLAAAGEMLNELLMPLVKPLALAVSCLVVCATSISRSVKVATPLPAAVPRSTLVVPSNAPVPELRVMLTTLLAGKPLVESLPNWSRVRTTG